MPRVTQKKPFIVLLSISITGFFIGAGYYKLSAHSKRPTLQEQFAKIEETNKMRIPLRVEFLIDESSIAESSSDVTTVKAQAIGAKAVAESGLKYRWQLPEGVMNMGPDKGDVTMDESGRMIVEGQFKGFSKESFQKLALFIENADQSLSASHIFVSRPEDTLEAKALDMMESAQELEEANKESHE